MFQFQYNTVATKQNKTINMNRYGKQDNIVPVC